MMMSNTLPLWLVALTLPLCVTGCGSSSSDNPTNSSLPSDTTNDVNTPPVVAAGQMQSVESGDVVTLTADVTDEDDVVITWRQLSGTQVVISALSGTTMTFVAPVVTDVELLVFEVSADDGINAAVTDSVSVEVSPAGASEPSPDPVDSAWIVNHEDTRSSHILESSSGQGVLVNVQSVSQTFDDGDTYTVVVSQGIPNYQVTITQALLSWLNNRPRAVNDFVTGETTVSVGDVIHFGADIGYRSNNSCATNAGYGYWPPGPVCPEQDPREVYLPQQPQATEEACASGLGKVGLWVNGSSIYNWGDGQSYNGGDWQTLAPVAEQYDVDLCGGHAANGDYHHHFYSSCLAEMVSDTGNGHSPLYGYAADGYPIYGPWEASGQLAVSAWTVRDYSAQAATGCADGSRSCVLVDPFDVSQGTESANQGPGFDQTISTLSGNQLVATNGYFYEDYYWEPALSALEGPYLDQYNGHYDEQRGYHYHVTVVESDGNLTPSFPYTIGTRFAGQLADNSIARCSTGQSMPPRG